MMSVQLTHLVNWSPRVQKHPIARTTRPSSAQSLLLNPRGFQKRCSSWPIFSTSMDDGLVPDDDSDAFDSPKHIQDANSNSTTDVYRKRSSLGSLFCYDKPIPVERIEKPIGLSLAEKRIGGNPRCTDCEAKGAVLCITCSGSGLYVDAILESQGIIVKVRCLGCGGTGNVMCSECGGRGHLGPH